MVTAEIMDANMKEADRWLRQGERDLVSARNSCRSGDFEWACFQAQQSAQKALLYAQGFRRILTHSVYELIREVARIRARVPGAEGRSEGTR
ncbi:HEPN domain-containing protein [Methanoculleus bourgensis]|uniref:HEPN domain-containing protein n=1 Tax=Methanoculleus bourgensis TaxID=83986 RepID=UPI003B96478A